MKLSRLIDQQFQNHFIRCGDLVNTMGAFKYKTIRRAVEQAVKDYEEVRAKLLDEHCMKDETGKLKYLEDGRSVPFKSEISGKTFQEEVKKLGETEFAPPEKLSVAAHFKINQLNGNDVFWMDELITE